jgi:hypothetical protein
VKIALRLQNVQQIPLGLEPGLVGFDVHPLDAHSVPGVRACYEDLINELRVLPGVALITLLGKSSGVGMV